MIRVRLAVLSLLLLSCFARGQQKLDPAIERRVDALLKQMTIEEKAGQLSQFDGDSPTNLDIVKQGQAGSMLNVLGVERTTAAQKIAIEQTRLKIPLIFGFDVIHGYRTIFPVPIASASSFDPQMIEQSERVAGKEASAAGIKWAFAPMVDIARDVRWGRMVEGAGEDPYLGSLVGAARVRGFQGASMSDATSVVASVKHFAGYGAAEGGRDYNTVDISEQLLREVYLPPFHAAANAGAGTFMAGFEDLNGVPATANHHTLTDILRGEWKYTGFVVSDYNSVMELMNHGVAADGAEAALKALTAGTDMSMVDGLYRKWVPDLVKSGRLPISVVNEAVRRVLRVKFEAGLFDHPYGDPKRESTELLTAENRQTARKMAQESIILLKNDGNILPLDKSIKNIAVIGPLADDKAAQLGSWVGNGQAADAVSPLEGIHAKVPNAQIFYSAGVTLESLSPRVIVSVLTAAPAPSSATGAAGVNTASGPTSIEDAVSAAQKADVVVMFLGEPAGMTGEASSRSSIDLPGKQQELLSAVSATGKPIVLVLESGRPLDMRWAKEHVPTMVQAWYLGTESGNAIADMLFGDSSPSARLPITWPQVVGQTPIYYNHKSTGRATSPDRWHTGYQYDSNDPLYPFGYGLTYTTFKYGNLKVLTSTISSSGILRVSAEIHNAGSRPGTEVVQLYVHDRVAPTSRPVRELKGISRVTLGPGESKTVEFSVNASDLGSYDPKMNWVVPSGTYDVWVAPNAVEGVAGTFEVGK
ncbi:MAG TPA: beta-glucosidase BglX [Terriglobales bacterium]|nr:beta-glucosidase BglX [Terriglobales bacterium]